MAYDAYLISNFLGVSVEYLLTGKEIKTNQEIEKIRSLLRKIEMSLSAI